LAAARILDLEGEHLGVVELPGCDGVVSSYVLADAIAARFCWPILGRYFERRGIPREVHDRAGTSVSRRAALPSSAAAALIEDTAAAGEPAIRVPAVNGRPDRVIYAPDLFWRRDRRLRLPWRRGVTQTRRVPAHEGSIHKRQVSQDAVTDRLPILMYHHVASGLPSALKRHSVTPEAFETQLAYLRDAGYHSVSLDDWCRAASERRPLAGRGVWDRALS
jgi:hypothetical protein